MESVVRRHMVAHLIHHEIELKKTHLSVSMSSMAPNLLLWPNSLAAWPSTASRSPVKSVSLISMLKLLPERM